MFTQMRSAVGIPKSADILDFIHALPPTEQERAFAQVEAIEKDAMSRQVPQPGLAALLRFLDGRGVKKAICTRNFECGPLLFLPAKQILRVTHADAVSC